MAVINVLNINVVANVDKAVKGFKKVEKSVDRLSAFTSQASAKIAAMGGALAGAALGAVSLNRAVSAVAESFRRLDTLGKTADKLGLASENLAGLRFAAEQTGVAVRTFDLGLQRMARRIAEAAVGTGEAQNALKELGVDAKAISRLSTDKQFYAIADAMENVTNASERVRLGFKLFDSEGVALINTLQGGARQLDQYQKQANDLGIAVGGKMIDSIEAANDAINRMKKAMDGLANSAATKLAPSLAVLADGWARFLSAGSSNDPIEARVAELRAQADLISRFSVSQALTGKDKYVSVLRAEATNLEYVTKLREKLERLRANSLSTRVDNAFDFASGKLQQALNKLRTAGTQAVEVWNELRAELHPAEALLDSMSQKMDEATLSSRDLFSKQAEAVARTREEFKKLMASFDAYTKQVKANELRDALSTRLESVLDSIKTPAQRLREYIDELNELGKMLTSEQRKTAIEAMAERLGLLGSSIVQPAGSPQALQRGSAEQRSFQIASMNRLLGRDESAEKERKRQTKLQELISQNTAKTAEAFAGLSSVVLVDR